MYYSKTFIALLEEAQFTKEILAIGVTQLYKANYAAKGIYYQSFTCLSTGIERLEKLCLILDYYIQNRGALPSYEYVRHYGHKIPDLYNACHDIVKQHKMGFRFRYKMDKDIHQAIINLLGSFAESSGRYSNINILTGKERNSTDCIEQWFHNVDIPLYNKHIHLAFRGMRVREPCLVQASRLIRGMFSALTVPCTFQAAQLPKRLSSRRKPLSHRLLVPAQNGISLKARLCV